MNPYNILKISKTLAVISECWENAEKGLIYRIENFSPDLNENEITQNFHEIFAEKLTKKSKQKIIEQSFLSDLEEEFSGKVESHDLQSIANGIIAEVTLHSQQMEKESGGDFGLVIERPHIFDSPNALNIDRYKRGLLCQAKLKRSNGKFGNLTDNQKIKLSDKLSYLALVLYRYKNTRQNLGAFDWQLCHNASSVDDLKCWLSKDSFPNLTDSKYIIHGVGNAKIGTDEDSVIEKYICKENNRSLVIKIDWPKDKDPGSYVYVSTRQESKQKVSCFVRQLL